MSNGNIGAFSPSVDKIKPELGYIENNCRWILLGLNSMKSTGTDTDMLYIAQALIHNYNTPV